MKLLVGSTGFVGSNLKEKCKFDGEYNSKNIQEAYGKKPDLLVYSGVPAQKFLANQNPEDDMKIIENAIQNIKKINPKKIVLISTIDVYKNPVNVDEDTIIEDKDLQPYGKNRYYLEEWVKSNFKEYLIVHLPGLYGSNIKKNFIYDLIKIIPSMLKEEKYNELINKDDFIKDYYEKLDNGFYKCKELSDFEKERIKNYFEKIGFSALNFTDSRGIFQFYNLSYLWEHIEIALKNNIKILNLATEPVSIAELYEYIKKGKFTNEITDNIPNYDFKTKYDSIYNGRDGYIFDKNFILKDIKKFVKKQSDPTIKLSISNIAWNERYDTEIYEYLKKNKVTGLEIAPTKFVGEDPYNNILLAVNKAKMLKEKYDIQIVSIQSIWYGKTENIFNSREEFDNLVDYTVKAIDFASAIKCPNIVFGCPKNRNMQNYELDYPKALEFFKKIGIYAKKKNVVIAIEPNPPIYNTNFLNGTEETLKFVKEINLKSIKINYDFGTVIENNEKLKVLEDNLDYINHIHISEPSLEIIKKKEIHKELYSILKSGYYQKFVSIEMKDQENIENIKKVLRYVISLNNEETGD